MFGPPFWRAARALGQLLIVGTGHVELPAERAVSLTFPDGERLN
jgi:hypothetical protein